MTNGTEWVEPGQGATFNDLICAALEEIDAKRLRHPGTISPVVARDADATNRKSNLRLTGAPLTAYDVRRIGEAK